MSATFTVLTPENTAVITLTDSRPNNFDQQEWAIEATTKCIAHAVLMYAFQRGIKPERVGYSVKLPEGMKLIPD